MLPYLFGASQLSDSVHYLPESIYEERAMQDSSNYMYFACIQTIKLRKKGTPFTESQPVLNDISGVPSWEKVTYGLFKMF